MHIEGINQTGGGERPSEVNETSSAQAGDITAIMRRLAGVNTPRGAGVGGSSSEITPPRVDAADLAAEEMRLRDGRRHSEQRVDMSDIGPRAGEAYKPEERIDMADVGGNEKVRIVEPPQDLKGLLGKLAGGSVGVPHVVASAEGTAATIGHAGQSTEATQDQGPWDDVDQTPPWETSDQALPWDDVDQAPPWETSDQTAQWETPRPTSPRKNDRAATGSDGTGRTIKIGSIQAENVRGLEKGVPEHVKIGTINGMSPEDFIASQQYASQPIGETDAEADMSEATTPGADMPAATQPETDNMPVATTPETDTPTPMASAPETVAANLGSTVVSEGVTTGDDFESGSGVEASAAETDTSESAPEAPDAEHDGTEVPVVYSEQSATVPEAADEQPEPLDHAAAETGDAVADEPEVPMPDTGSSPLEEKQVPEESEETAEPAEPTQPAAENTEASEAAESASNQTDETHVTDDEAGDAPEETGNTNQESEPSGNAEDSAAETETRKSNTETDEKPADSVADKEVDAKENDQPKAEEPSDTSETTEAKETPERDEEIKPEVTDNDASTETSEKRAEDSEEPKPEAAEESETVREEPPELGDSTDTDRSSSAHEGAPVPAQDESQPAQQGQNEPSVNPLTGEVYDQGDENASTRNTTTGEPLGINPVTGKPFTVGEAREAAAEASRRIMLDDLTLNQGLGTPGVPGVPGAAPGMAAPADQQRVQNEIFSTAQQRNTAQGNMWVSGVRDGAFFGKVKKAGLLSLAPIVGILGGITDKNVVSKQNPPKLVSHILGTKSTGLYDVAFANGKSGTSIRVLATSPQAAAKKVESYWHPVTRIRASLKAN